MNKAKIAIHILRILNLRVGLYGKYVKVMDLNLA